MPDDSAIALAGPGLCDAAERAGLSARLYEHQRELVEKAGFTNIQEKKMKCPIGTWTKHTLFKEAGHYQKMYMKEGEEGRQPYVRF